MAEPDKDAGGRPDLASLDAAELRGLLGDVQRRLAEIDTGTGAGGLLVRNVGDADVEILMASGSSVVAAGETAELDPEPVQLGPDSGADESSAVASRPRSVVAFRLSVDGDRSGAVRVELAALASGAARHGRPEALVRTQSGKNGESGSWTLARTSSIELTIEPGAAVDAFVVGRGPLLDAAALARRAFAGLEQSGGRRQETGEGREQAGGEA